MDRKKELAVDAANIVLDNQIDIIKDFYRNIKQHDIKVYPGSDSIYNNITPDDFNKMIDDKRIDTLIDLFITFMKPSHLKQIIIDVSVLEKILFRDDSYFFKGVYTGFVDITQYIDSDEEDDPDDDISPKK